MRIFQKWLTILAIPLAFEIIVVVVMLLLVNQANNEINEQLRSQIVKSNVEKIILAGDEAAFLLVEFAYVEDPGLIAEFNVIRAGTQESLEELRKMIDSNDSRQMACVERLASTWQEFVGMMDGMKLWVKGNKSASTNMQVMTMIAIKEKLSDGSLAVKDLYDIRSELDDEVKSRHTATKLSLAIWMVLAIVLNFLFAIFVTFKFCRDITNRIDTLRENSLRLALGQSMLPSAGGSDEISDFDKVFRDVATALQDSFDRERANFDNAADAICALDPAGRITRVNEAFQATLGYETGDILQTYLVNYVNPDEREKLPEVLKNVQAETGTRRQYEIKMQTASGKTRDFLWSIVWEPSQKLCMCVGHDMTDYKRLERAKQEFVAMLSHDLRSPLTSIGATFELVISGAFGDVTEKLWSTLDRARGNVRRLIALISELLDLEKLEAGEMDLHISKAPVSRIVQQAVDAVAASAEQNDIVLEPCQSDLTIYADEDRLVRVIVNFLSNAIKFSPENGVVTIDATENEDGVIEIRVSDQGKGIPEEHIDKIFERYKQVSRFDHSVKKGSGLGLSICKAIVEAHGGTIGVTSKVGSGSTFWFRIP